MQLITNHDELHAYAAGKVVEGLRRGAAGDALLGAAAYLLGALQFALYCCHPSSLAFHRRRQGIARFAHMRRQACAVLADSE